VEEISRTEQGRARGCEGLPPSPTAFQDVPSSLAVLPITQRVLCRQVNAVLVLKVCTDLTLGPPLGKRLRVAASFHISEVSI